MVLFRWLFFTSVFCSTFFLFLMLSVSYFLTVDVVMFTFVNQLEYPDGVGKVAYKQK